MKKEYYIYNSNSNERTESGLCNNQLIIWITSIFRLCSCISTAWFPPFNICDLESWTEMKNKNEKIAYYYQFDARKNIPNIT